MSHFLKVVFAAAAIAVFLCSLHGEASARGKFPLTRCGPGLAYLCPIHGYFDQPPFHYGLAIYPGCIRTQLVETPAGMQRRPVLVCG
jgi:hypothetical protein